MSVLLTCCAEGQPYLGIDPDCPRTALICLTHSAHAGKDGTIHNLLPLVHFKSTLNDLKFDMADKVSSLIDMYSAFMDELID